jgi:WD40 repeat protein
MIMRTTLALAICLLGVAALSAPAPEPRLPKLPFSFHVHDKIRSLAFHPSGLQIAVCGREGAVLWAPSATKGNPTPLVRGKEIYALAFSPSGDTLSLASEEAVHLWDVKSTKSAATLDFSSKRGVVLSVAFSPDGKTLAAGRGGGPVRLWDLATRKVVGEIPLDCAPYGLAFGPDGQTLAAGDMSAEEIKLWELKGMQLKWTAGAKHHDVTSLAFRPDGKTLASGGRWDQLVRLWDASSGKEVAILEGHDNSVWAVAFSPDGNTIVSASGDKTVRLWNAITGKVIRKYQMNGPAAAVKFGTDGRCLAVGMEDGTVMLLPVGR